MAVPSSRRDSQVLPAWKSWFVGMSLLTDPGYVSYRVRRRWARLAGTMPPQPSPTPPSAEGEPELPPFDVDLVCLWVCGQDPKHREKRRQWLERAGLQPALSNPDVRYVEEDELRYALRSAEEFVPWIRRIFLVTDDQVPAWLNREHPRVRVVDHREIIDPQWLPTFNTKVIINSLHRIPGLSEHFLYTNDDCFFGQPCRREDFFARRRVRGKDRVVMRIMFPQAEKNFDSWIVPAHLVQEPLARLWMSSYNTLKVMLETRRPWEKFRYVDCHQTQPMLRSELAGAVQAFPEAHRRTASSRFRNPNDISFISVARHRSYARGMAVQGYVSHRFFPFERDLSEYTRESLPALFCINAGLGDETLREKRILARLFPTPAAFELPAAVPST
jgi:hypothetical protein